MKNFRVGGAAGFPATLDTSTGALELREAEAVSRSALEHLLALEGVHGARFLERRGDAVRFRVPVGRLSPTPKP